MVIYKNNSTDAYFNLASEQYLLDNFDGEIFMLWRNDNAVIVGKNQNTYAEIDYDYVNQNNIKVVRRLTGGGAVFHDKGNVNFSFIVPHSESATLDFARFTQPVIEALESLGAKNVCLSGRNDILIEGTKISGNAQSSYNGKTLHHGTLLYDSDISMLVGALRVDEEKIKSKGIKSVRNRVNNIKDIAGLDMSTLEFMDYLEKYIAKKNNAEIVEFTEQDKSDIQKLADEKYSTWEWNYGKSKEFSVSKKKRFDFGTVNVNITAENGIIKQIKIYGDYFGTNDVCEIENALLMQKYDEQNVLAVIEKYDVSKYISGITGEELLRLFFS